MKNLRSKAMQVAHKIKSYIESWGDTQRVAWIIARLNLNIDQMITFAKVGTGEERKAHAVYASLNDLEKGCVRFRERVSDSLEQWRSFRVETLIFN